MQPIFWVGLSASTKMIKKIPHGKAQQLVFWFILDAVQLTTKISNHNTPTRGCDVMTSGGEAEYTLKQGDGHSRCLDAAFGKNPPHVNSPALTLTA